jgi:hypothetical protein
MVGLPTRLKSSVAARRKPKSLRGSMIALTETDRQPTSGKGPVSLRSLYPTIYCNECVPFSSLETVRY